MEVREAAGRVKQRLQRGAQVDADRAARQPHVEGAALHCPGQRPQVCQLHDDEADRVRGSA
jgi:hypothetical protein